LPNKLTASECKPGEVYCLGENSFIVIDAFSLKDQQFLDVYHVTDSLDYKRKHRKKLYNSDAFQHVLDEMLFEVEYNEEKKLINNS